MIRTIRTWITPIELRPNLPAQCACGCRRAGMGAPRNAIQVGRENGRPKRGWEPRTRKRRSARALRPPRTVGAAYEVLQRGKGAVCVLWCGKDEEQRERRVCGVVSAVMSFLHDHPVYQQAAGACASGCAGVWCWRRCARMCVLMPKQRQTATWMSRRTQAVIHYPRSGKWCESGDTPACRWRVSQTADEHAAVRDGLKCSTERGIIGYWPPPLRVMSARRDFGTPTPQDVCIAPPHLASPPPPRSATSLFLCISESTGRVEIGPTVIKNPAPVAWR